MLNFIVDLFPASNSSNKTLPRSKWDPEKSQIFALLLVDKTIPVFLSKSMTSDVQRHSLILQVSHVGFHHPYNKIDRYNFDRYNYYRQMIDDCYNHPADQELCLYWTKSEKIEGQKSWRPSTDNASITSAKHLTYSEFYGHVPWLVRRKLIRLERLENFDLMRLILKLSQEVL
jgi:hypothetical protein